MPRRAVSLLVGILFSAMACGPTVFRPRLHAPSQVPTPAPKALPLKVHLHSGEMLLLDSWGLEGEGRILRGVGTRYTVRREGGASGPQSVARDEIALLETTDRKTVSTLATVGLSTLTFVYGTLSVVCLADPKTCFGSCPTFYGPDDEERPLAEGFSASVARVLEARDVDALPDLQAPGGRVTLVMRNEAQETHAVRRVRLLSVDRPRGASVLQARDGGFRVLTRLSPPLACQAPEGDCREALLRDDGRERTSGSEPHDLAAREDLLLDFAEAPARAGLVIRARQTLLTTFLFYQTLAYMGASAGEWLASAERNGRPWAEELMGMGRVLGGIEIAVADAEGAWHPAGTFDEAGPISGDRQVIPLPLRSEGAPLRIRLRMAKGHWRVDQVAVGEAGPRREAVALDPEVVEREGRPDPEARRALLDQERHLITLPGDAYRLVFALPRGAEDSALFLESEGYYYEWMRAEWLAEEDETMLALVVSQPEEALRRLAAPWKDREAGAERTFWSSRFGR